MKTMLIASLLTLLLYSPSFAMGESLHKPADESSQQYLYSSEEVVDIISKPSGARIEIQNDDIGKTPLKIKLRKFREKKEYTSGYYNDNWFYNGANAGTFLTITAYPVKGGQYTQFKILDSTVATPKRIFFDMNLMPAR